MLKYLFNLDQFFNGPKDWDLEETKASKLLSELSSLDDNNLSNNSHSSLQEVVTKTLPNESVPVTNTDLSVTNNISSVDLDPINYVSSEVVNYAGITILGCIVSISSAITMLYLNHLTLKYTDDNIDKAPKVVQIFYEIYGHTLTFNPNVLKLLVLTCSLLLISTGIYLTTL